MNRVPDESTAGRQQPKESSAAPPRTAIVLAGGGSLGAIEVGMLKALTAHGVRADLVVGASVGAINGACFAGSPDMAGVRLLERLWRGLRQERVFRFSRLSSLLDLASRRDYLVSPEPLRNLLERCLPFRRLEDAAIPCHVVATDVLYGTEVVLSSGPAVEALMASASIPPVFPPVRIGERFLVDSDLRALRRAHGLRIPTRRERRESAPHSWRGGALRSDHRAERGADDPGGPEHFPPRHVR